MFGFSNRKKKIANEVATSVLNTIRLCFITSNHIDERGIFRAPYGFWVDNYVVGFAFALSGFFLKFDAGSYVKSHEKGEIILLTFEDMCGDNYKQAITIANESAFSKQNEDFNLGVNHASTAYGAMSGRLKADDPDPILAEAKSLALGQHEINIKMAEMMGESEPSTNSSIGMAVIELTIMKYVKNKYLQN